MTSRERVRNAVRHLPSDRVPTLYGDVSWISLPNTRTNRPDGGYMDEWGVINIPRGGTVHGERLHPVTTITGLVAHPFPDPLRPERWDGVLERIAAARDSWTMVVLGPAIWEQIHFLCPMEDAMAWLYEYPEEMGSVADLDPKYQAIHGGFRNPAANRRHCGGSIFCDGQTHDEQ